MKQADIDHNEIIEMVNQAGCKSYTPPPTRAVAGVSMTFAQLEAFAKLVRERERNEILDSFSPEEPIENWIDKILARGQQ